jgi:hypothetical protein
MTEIGDISRVARHFLAYVAELYDVMGTKTRNSIVGPRYLEQDGFGELCRHKMFRSKFKVVDSSDDFLRR